MTSSWWAVPEGILGTGISIATGHASLYHVIQSASKPVGGAGNPVYGPYATQTQAQAQANELNGIAQTGAAAGEKAAGAAGNPLAGLQDIGSFFDLLGQRQTWIRVAEVVVGLLLVGTAVSHLAANTQAGQTIIATGKQAAKLAAIA